MLLQNCEKIKKGNDLIKRAHNGDDDEETE